MISRRAFSIEARLGDLDGGVDLFNVAINIGVVDADNVFDNEQVAASIRAQCRAGL